MSQQPKYRIYATLLDSYLNMVESDKVWDKYWGQSKNPPHTMEQFHWLQVESFINGINRCEREPSMPASRGTAFNELIDALIEWRKPNVDSFQVMRGEDGKATQILCGLDGFEFVFDAKLLREMAAYYNDAVCQYYTSGIMNTIYGKVELYGYIDELMPTCIHDVKTTGSYEFPKFAKHAQHLVYPYCLKQQGMDIADFQYDVVVFPKYGPTEVCSELYTFHDEDEQRLRLWVEDVVAWLDMYRPLITDPKMLGGETHSVAGIPVTDMGTKGMPWKCVEIIDNIKQTHQQLGK